MPQAICLTQEQALLVYMKEGGGIVQWKRLQNIGGDFRMFSIDGAS